VTGISPTVNSYDNNRKAPTVDGQQRSLPPLSSPP
jgi:hypothetical protein